MRFIKPRSRKQAEELLKRKITDKEYRDLRRKNGDTDALRIILYKEGFNVCAPWLMQEYFSI